MFITKRRFNELNAELRTEKFKKEQLEKEVKTLKEQNRIEVTNVMLKAGKDIEKLEQFILNLKQVAFGKGTIVEILDDIRKFLIEFKM